MELEQDVQQSITAAFHSVELIDAILIGDVMESDPINDKVQRVDANVGHLNLMLSKEWFSEALTVEQRGEMELVISSGSAYVAQNR
jgi:hypothetical protein